MAEHIFSGADFTARSTEIAGEDVFHYIWVAEDGAFVAKKVGTASTTTDAVAPAGYVRRDTPANTSGVVDGDYENLQGSDGAAWVMQRPVVSAGTSQYNLAISTTAVSLTVPSGSRYALFRVADGPVRFRDDGADPTTSVGMLLNTGDSLEYDGPLSAIRFIRSSGVNATLNVAYYK